MHRDDVELWLAPVAASYDPAQLSAYEALLDAEERTRWQRFHYAADRLRFLVGRAFLRKVLAAYLGYDDAATLQFARLPQGKPVLAGTMEGRLQFNLSHTNGLLALAISETHAVGVDVEAVTRKVELLALAQRYFAPREYAALQQLDGTAQREHFFALWTLKEAWLKARGLGLREPLDAFTFDLSGAHPVIDCSALPGNAPEAWQFRRFTQDQFRIALAVNRAVTQPLQVQLREWQA